ncbi:hypothetical protein HYR69_09665 [Candidatus Sumerlaeota bacterium]|nr:hypothetical protein [Candidatus Sumerlaeota bacterium]
MADLQKKLANLQGAKSPLDTVLKRQFTPGQLSDVVSDVYRLVRHSTTLRGKFAAPGVADVLAKSDPRLAGLAKLNANPSIEAHR